MEKQLLEQTELWKEFTNDQMERQKFKEADPDRQEEIKKAIASHYMFASSYLSYVFIKYDEKYGVVERNYTNFMDWLANGKPKFKGIEVKVKE